MDISRRIGILIFTAVPAIVGGGIVYGIFNDFIPVFIYEAMLYALAGGIVSK